MESETVSVRRNQLPPGPSGKWRSTLRLIRNPRAAMEGWVKQFGDPFLLTALNGPVIVTGRADLIRTIHGQDPDTYETFATQTTAPMLGPGSMLVLFGERHRRERRMISPMFHGDRMKSYGEIMQEMALLHTRSCLSHGVVRIVDLMTDISLDVIIRAIFGGHDRQLASQMFNASKKLVARANPLLFFTRKTHFSCLGFSPWDRWKTARGELCQLLDKAIKQRNRSTESHHDILTLLCEAGYEDGTPISRDDIHAELITFLFAGHETTALSMAWAIYHIHRNSHARERLLQELYALTDEAPETLAAAPYLKAVIHETLRMNPIVTETLRKCRKPMQLEQYDVPVGMAVAPATVLAHYNPDVYPEPDEFRPERFIERSFSPFEFMPFGGGHRRCIGAPFAMYEMAMVLGVLLRNFKFELMDKEPVVPKRRSVTMGPSTDIPARITPK
ncbi:MAG TPA: cytochrome P450 [Pirellulaceae bacterium]|nr:cytochrome P450 [Pirellulaceae bacterium]HMP69824.1 cytochrome P450 [Pirellulaceae bacterium]